MQFGIFDQQLQIDEKMVPYLGTIPAKCSFAANLSGLVTNCDAFALKLVIRITDRYDKHIWLGADVVLQLVDNIQDPSHHTIYFEDFSTSYYLMCLFFRKNTMCNRHPTIYTYYRHAAENWKPTSWFSICIKRLQLSQALIRPCSSCFRKDRGSTKSAVKWE